MVFLWLYHNLYPNSSAGSLLRGPSLEGTPVVLHHLHGFPAPRGKRSGEKMRKLGKDLGKDGKMALDHSKPWFFTVIFVTPWESNQWRVWKSSANGYVYDISL